MSKIILILFIFSFQIAQARVFFRSCNEYSRTGVSFSYQSCIQDNFRQALQALPNTFLSTCHEFGQGVSFSYISCIDRNFNDIERETNLFLSYCTNFSTTELSYSFQACVNQNFSTLERHLNQESSHLYIGL